jgi:hypothetical protein
MKRITIDEKLKLNSIKRDFSLKYILFGNSRERALLIKSYLPRITVPYHGRRSALSSAVNAFLTATTRVLTSL